MTTTTQAAKGALLGQDALLHPRNPPTRPSRRLKAWGAACAVLVLAAAAAAFLFEKIQNDPSVVLVYSRDGADWIRMPEAPRLSRRDLGDYQTSFRTRFTLATVPPVANLEFRAHRDANVFVNSVRVANTRRAAHRWKETRFVDLAAHLRPGTNTIQIEVYARNAPRLLWASAPALSLRSNAHWEASNDGQTWALALPASAAVPSELSTSFQKPSEGFVTILPILGPVFVLVFILHYVPRQRRDQLDFARIFTPSRVRWAILMAWVVLAGNNILKIPPWVGLDIPGHLDYIQYIHRFHRLPLAHEGWQTFQSPLYYVISVLPYAAFIRTTHQDGVIQLLRFLPLLCGIAQVEICYRAARRVYPNRRDMQVVCTALGGLLPMEPLHLPVHRKRAPRCMSQRAYRTLVHIHSHGIIAAFGDESHRRLSRVAWLRHPRQSHRGPASRARLHRGLLQKPSADNEPALEERFSIPGGRRGRERLVLLA